MNLTVFEFNGQAVRSTGDGRFSVFDVLVAFIPPSERKGVKGKSINPRQVYKSIAERYPEVVHFVDNFQFPGKGQRSTPVSTSAIRKVFEFAEANPCLLLIDGFDWSMGTFLQLLGEYHPTNGLLVATANLPKSTREEISWRFDDAIQMLKPGSSKIESLLKQSLSSMDLGDIDWEALSWQMPNASFAQVVRVAQNAAKSVVIGRRERVEQKDLEEAIRGLEIELRS